MDNKDKQQNLHPYQNSKGYEKEMMPPPYSHPTVQPYTQDHSQPHVQVNMQSNSHPSTNMPYQWDQNTSITNLQPLSMPQWILTIGVGMIPVVGFILYIIWAFSTNENTNRKNYCRACIIVGVGAVSIYFFISIMIIIWSFFAFVR